MLIVEARFYEHIADALLTGATRVLEEAGAQCDRIAVPGALEVPAAIAMALDAAQRKKAPYDGVVALGCVIQGETYHFDLVANESARGLDGSRASPPARRSATASSPSITSSRRLRAAPPAPAATKAPAPRARRLP